MPEFNFLGKLPLLIFTLAFFIVFVLFLRAGFVVFRAGGDSQKLERGRKLLLDSLYGFFIILLIALVFFSVTYLLQKGEAFQPPEVLGEFPPLQNSNFPPPPQFIKIGRYYFNGPWLLKKNNVIKEVSIYAILCKKNATYDIIYIDQTERTIPLLAHEEYKCWIENCAQKLEGLYLATFLTPLKMFPFIEREKIKGELEKEINPPCPHTKQGQGAEGA